MRPPHWLRVLGDAIEMAPGFLAALDEQLRSHARRLTGMDIAAGGYTLLARDCGFTVQFQTTSDGVVGSIDGELVDPSASGYRVSLAWRAADAPDEPIHPTQDRSDLEFFWAEFPVAALSASPPPVQSRHAALAVTAGFSVDWDVHELESVFLVINGHRRFRADELTAVQEAVEHAVRDWNASEPATTIDYLSEPVVSDDRAVVRWYLDLNAAGLNALVTVINALGESSAAHVIAECSVGQRY